MSVVISMEDTGPCRKQLTVEIPAPAVEAETRRVVADFGRQARIPGFRKGKVPARVIEQRFKKDIDAEVVERLLPRYWKQAEAESGVETLLPPEVDEVDHKPGEPLTFRASVEVRPDVELGDVVFSIPNPPVEPTEEEIDEALLDLRRRFGDWVPVERTAAQGDLVSVQVQEEGAGEDAEPDSLQLEVGSDQVWEELSVAVTGLAEGQEAEFKRRTGEGEAAEEKTYRVKVVAVKELELADLDDELAATVGEFEDLAALRAQVVEGIERRKARDRDQQRRKDLLDQMRERYPLELPQRVVDKEVERMLSDYAGSLSMQGVDLDKVSLDWRRMGEQMRPQAALRVHARLLLDAAARVQEVQVTEPELESALASIAREQKMSTPAVRQALDKSGRLLELRAQLQREKTIKRLLGEEEASGDEAPEAGGQVSEPADE